MSQVVNTLVTRYTLSNTQYMNASGQVIRQTQRMSTSYQNAQQALIRQSGGMASGLDSLLGKIVGVGLGLKALQMTVLGTAHAASRTAEYESLALAIENIEGNAKAARYALRQLEDVGRLPGISYEEAQKGYIGLRQSGFGRESSMRLMTQTANWNALMGGGMEEFGRIMLVMTQMISSRYLQGNDPRQLKEARIPIYDILSKNFGTSSTEDLQAKGITSRDVIAAVIKHMENAPRAADKAKNAYQNLTEAIDKAFGSATSAGTVFFGMAQSITAAIDKLREGGIFDTMFGRIADAVASIVAKLGGKNGFEGAMLNLASVIAVASDQMSAFGDVLGPSGFMGIVRATVEFIHNMWVTLSKIPVLGKGAEIPAAATGIVLEGFKNYDATLKGMKTDLEISAERRAREQRMAAPPDPGDKPLTPESDTVSRIERNTFRAADALQRMEQTVFGGGDLARMGVTPVEAKGIRSGASEIGEMVQQVFDRGVVQGMRQAKRLGYI